MTAASYATAAAPLLATPDKIATSKVKGEPELWYDNTKQSIMSQIAELSRPTPQSYTLTAVLKLLEPLEENQPDVFLMTRSYLQNWLVWAFHQKIPATESTRAEAGLRLAAERMGLTPPYHGMQHDNPGPINSSILSMEGHPLLLRPNVTVSDSLSDPELRVPSILRRVKSLPEEVEKKDDDGDSPEFDSLDFQGNQILCCAVPQQFYEVRIRGISEVAFIVNLEVSWRCSIPFDPADFLFG